MSELHKQIKTVFHDGVTSDEKDVQVVFYDEYIEITEIADGKKHRWEYAKIEVEEAPIDGRKGLISCSDEKYARLYLEADDFKEVKRRIPRSKSKALRLTAGILVAMAAIIGLVFFLIPALAPVVLPHVPQSWDKKLGDYAARYFIDSSELCSSPEADAQLQKVAELLAQDDNEFELEFLVQRSEVVNAFALPGGKIVIFSELIKQAESQEELLGVLAHEAAHVHYRHGTERMLRHLMSALIIDTLTGGAGTVAYAGTQMHALKYGQAQELESDSHAIKELHRLNVEPTKMADFFQRMNEKAKTKNGDEGILAELEEYISSHPSDTARIDNIHTLSEKLKAGSGKFAAQKLWTDKEWRKIKQICN